MRFTKDFIENSSIPVTESGCWLWLGKYTPNGYGVINKYGKSYAAHRVSYSIFKGRIVNGTIMHICNVKACVNPLHLIDGSPADNAYAAMKDGLNPPRGGEYNGNAKLTVKDVQRIRDMYSTGKYKCTALAEMFGVSYSAISHIIKRITW